ncbi:MAG: ABC transporter permease [Brevinematales bacterium]|jgi:putative ABC transport system permease protein
MELSDFIITAVRSILKNKMRSFLTMLGIIIGISSVIVMVAIGAGAQLQIQDQISSMGVNLITVFPEAFRNGGVNQGGGSGSRLKYSDVKILKKQARLLSGVSPLIRTDVQVIGGKANWSTIIYGVSPDYLAIRSLSVSTGDVFSDKDLKVNAKVCILGETVATNLFGNANPVGKIIRIGQVPFRVIGVFAAKGFSGSGQDQDDMVVAPYTTVQYRLSRFPFLQMILCSSISGNKMEAAQSEIRSILRESLKIPQSSVESFTIRSQTDIISMATSTTRILTAFLASISGISLLVGGIGIMNIMLVSVTERTREIGIRLAVGARKKDILIQFLVEAVALCLTGGIIGIGLGIIIALAVRAYTGWNVVFQAHTVILSFVFSFFVGIFFGFYPARRASSLNPIDALRYEP